MPFQSIHLRVSSTKAPSQSICAVAGHSLVSFVALKFLAIGGCDQLIGQYIKPNGKQGAAFSLLVQWLPSK